MSTWFNRLLLGLLLSFLVVSNVNATVIWQNYGGTYPSGNGYWINDDGSYRDGDGYRIYDDVVLTEEATLVSLQYLMRLYDVNEFEFLITTNTNGRPGETIYQEILSTEDYFITEYESYSEINFNLSTQLDLNSGSYFVSLYGINGTESLVSQSYWGAGGDPSGSGLLYNETTGTLLYDYPIESNFILYDNEFEPAATPEPSTMLLLGFGLLSLARVSRKTLK